MKRRQRIGTGLRATRFPRRDSRRWDEWSRRRPPWRCQAWLTWTAVPSATAAEIDPFTVRYDGRVWGDYLLVGNSRLECPNNRADDPDFLDVDNDSGTTGPGPTRGLELRHRCRTDAISDDVAGGGKARQADQAVHGVHARTDTTTSGIFNSSDATFTIPLAPRSPSRPPLLARQRPRPPDRREATPTELNAAGSSIRRRERRGRCQSRVRGQNYTTYGNFSGVANSLVVANRMRAYREFTSGLSTEMKLRISGVNGDNYSTITADEFNITSAASLSGHLYQSEADVTSLLQQAVSGSPVTVTGANIATGMGFGCTGAWSLAIVYDYGRPDANAPDLRRIQIYDGLAEAADNDPVNVVLGGFLAATTGTVEPRVGLVGYEGDQQITGDGLDIESTTLNEPRLNGAPTTNYWTSTIGEYTTSTAGDFTRSPAWHDTAGADIKVVPFDATLLNAAGDGVTVTYGTTGDRYAPGVLIFSALESAVTGIVFEDTNDDGVQDPGELGITGCRPAHRDLRCRIRQPGDRPHHDDRRQRRLFVQRAELRRHRPPSPRPSPCPITTAWRTWSTPRLGRRHAGPLGKRHHSDPARLGVTVHPLRLR
ncbi:MAG: hypothetical protein R2705_07325 [Ilumatobacteraceae bacterium]